jgi:outer membrane lipopolysaccharide assembly protein LptE/RlpB
VRELRMDAAQQIVRQLTALKVSPLSALAQAPRAP